MKKVVIKVAFEMLAEVPDDWGKQAVESWLNESSHCLSTELAQLSREEAGAEKDCCFTCHRAFGEFVRVATDEDVKRLTPPNPEAR